MQYIVHKSNSCKLLEFSKQNKFRLLLICYNYPVGFSDIFYDLFSYWLSVTALLTVSIISPNIQLLYFIWLRGCIIHFKKYALPFHSSAGPVIAPTTLNNPSHNYVYKIIEQVSFIDDYSKISPVIKHLCKKAFQILGQYIESSKWIPWSTSSGIIRHHHTPLLFTYSLIVRVLYWALVSTVHMSQEL